MCCTRCHNHRKWKLACLSGILFLLAAILAIRGSDRFSALTVAIGLTTDEAVAYLGLPSRKALYQAGEYDVSGTIVGVVEKAKMLDGKSIRRGDVVITQGAGSIGGIVADILRALVDKVASFKQEVADVRRKIEPSGEVADHASPALASIRERLRRQKQRLRSTLDGFLRGKEASKYLQEQVVTDRNGRRVLMVRAEHRSSIPGIVHGGSASGASLFVEPLETVEINNDIVALEEQEAEEIRRILLELTDAFRQRPEELEQTIEVATEIDVIQARARFAVMTGSVEPIVAADGTFDLKGARHPLLMQVVRERIDPSLTRDSATDPVPVDIRPGANTGVALFNPNASASNVTISLYNAEGQKVIDGQPITLPANSQTAKFVSELLSVSNTVLGSLAITATQPVAAVTLRQNNPPLSYTTLPVAEGTAVAP